MIYIRQFEDLFIPSLSHSHSCWFTLEERKLLDTNIETIVHDHRSDNTLAEIGYLRPKKWSVADELDVSFVSLSRSFSEHSCIIHLFHIQVDMIKWYAKPFSCWWYVRSLIQHTHTEGKKDDYIRLDTWLDKRRRVHTHAPERKTNYAEHFILSMLKLRDDHTSCAHATAVHCCGYETSRTTREDYLSFLRELMSS